EIGVRLALGAGTPNVLRLVLGRTIPPALTGVAIGLVAALLLTRSMSALVFGVRTRDVVSLSVVAMLLLAVALLATLGPAIRATRVSPIEVIRLD
ncbi:MAG: FtsX-like permease family protein, partial [Gemmatimonadaceae bacterium]